jgi:hypothetical protein
MRYFRHALSGMISLSMEDELVWHEMLPDQTATDLPVLYLYSRCAVNRGRPEQEWRVEPIPKGLFEKVMEEISYEEAMHADEPLVRLIGRFQVYPCLPTVLQALPRGTFLHLLDWAATTEAILFDIYRASQAEDRHRLYLNPLLEPLLPWVEVEGVRHFCVPYPDNLKVASTMLVLRLERCLFGDSGPAFSFSYEHDLEAYDGKEA